MDQKAFAAFTALNAPPESAQLGDEGGPTPASGQEIVSLADLVHERADAKDTPPDFASADDLQDGASKTQQNRLPRARFVAEEVGPQEESKRRERQTSIPPRPAVVRAPKGSMPVRPVTPSIVRPESSPPQAVRPDLAPPRVEPAPVADAGRSSLYPTVDFCADPGVICRDDHPDLKWVAGFFYWLESVQSYDEGGGTTGRERGVYMDVLKAWVDNGARLSDTSLVDFASGVVNRGCHDSPHEGSHGADPCGNGEVHAVGARRKSLRFLRKLLTALRPSDGRAEQRRGHERSGKPYTVTGSGHETTPVTPQSRRGQKVLCAPSEVKARRRSLREPFVCGDCRRARARQAPVFAA